MWPPSQDPWSTTLSQNQSEEIYKQLQLDTKELSDDELIRLMVVYPDLIQRPIIEKGDRAVMGRPPENVKALL